MGLWYAAYSVEKNEVFELGKSFGWANLLTPAKHLMLWPDDQFKLFYRYANQWALAQAVHRELSEAWWAKSAERELYVQQAALFAMKFWDWADPNHHKIKMVNDSDDSYQAAMGLDLMHPKPEELKPKVVGDYYKITGSVKEEQ